MTAGPTFEAIDPVRGITNLSSGKMGAGYRPRGAVAGVDVTLVCGPVSQPTPCDINRIDVTSALEMHAGVLKRCEPGRVHRRGSGRRLPSKKRRRTKTKKDGAPPPVIELVQNPDILADVAALPRPPLCRLCRRDTESRRVCREKRRAKKNSA